MDCTSIIGRIVSAYLLTTGLGFLVSPDFFHRLASTVDSDPVLLNLSGMTHFFIGVTIVVLHFRWQSIHQGFVTVLGIAYTLKGALLIVIPDRIVQASGNEVQTNTIASGIGFLVVGGALAFLSWCAVWMRTDSA